jgi:predicted metal-dependent HD superfamily phosphohydrolase
MAGSTLNAASCLVTVEPMNSLLEPDRIDALAARIKERYWLPGEASYQPGAWAELDARYGEAHRAYHTWRHIDEIFERLASLSNVAKRRDIIIAATFWHDAVYDLRDEDGARRADRDNVRASADLFRRYTALSAGEASAVEDLIMGTADHLHARPDIERYPGYYNDFDLFLDLDLGSLASPWDQFETNLHKLRFENAMTAEADFYREQIAMLTRFREQDALLFRCKETRQRWSRDAAANLGRCIEELRRKLKAIGEDKR